jgi:hypothetical protein
MPIKARKTLLRLKIQINLKNNSYMKKVIFSGIVVLAIAAIAAINVNLNSQNENLLSDLALANVEALASGEGGNACPGNCNSWQGSGGGGVACDCASFTGICYNFC